MRGLDLGTASQTLLTAEKLFESLISSGADYLRAYPGPLSNTSQKQARRILCLESAPRNCPPVRSPSSCCYRSDRSVNARDTLFSKRDLSG